MVATKTAMSGSLSTGCCHQILYAEGVEQVAGLTGATNTESNTESVEPVSESGPSPTRAVRSTRPRSAADQRMRRLLRIPEARPSVPESSTNRIFGVSIVLSAFRCILTYLLLPVVLPAVGLTQGWGPLVAIPIGVLALVFDVLGIRRFWLADHHRRWAFSALYAVVGAMVFILLVADIVHVIAR